MSPIVIESVPRRIYRAHSARRLNVCGLYQKARFQCPPRRFEEWMARRLAPICRQVVAAKSQAVVEVAGHFRERFPVVPVRPGLALVPNRPLVRFVRYLHFFRWELCPRNLRLRSRLPVWRPAARLCGGSEPAMDI